MQTFQSVLMTYALLMTCLLFTSTTEAQFCKKTIKSRTGTVYGGGPAKTTFTATENAIDIIVTKTGGRAQTIVNVYVNGQMQVGKSKTFQNGNYSGVDRNIKLSGVKGKSIRVDIVNQSVGNKFEYRLKAVAETKALGSGQANLAGQGKKTFTLSTACDNNARITIKRTGGSAKAIIKVMRLNGQSLNGGGTVLDKNKSTITIPVSGVRNQRLRVEVKNVSVGNWFKFTMNARSTK